MADPAGISPPCLAPPTRLWVCIHHTPPVHLPPYHLTLKGKNGVGVSDPFLFGGDEGVRLSVEC